MFTSARKSMPPIDYVSIVRSVYKDRRAMVMGGLACTLSAAATAYKAGSPLLWAIVLGFVVVTAYRFFDMTAFRRANIGPTDVEAAARWEVRATYGAAPFALLCGAWCFISLVFVRDPAVELISLVTTVGCMVGVVTRNFGLDRLLTIQLAFALTLIASGLILNGDAYHWVLAAVMLPILISFRVLAGDVRAILLAAVHGRVEASRLALELDAALETMHHGLCMLDENGNIAVVNDRAEQAFAGFVAGRWRGRSFVELISGAASRGVMPQRTADLLLETVGQRGNGKIILHLIDGQYCEVTVSSRQERTVLLLEDITARVKAEERINFMAHYDALTGLPNRAYFSEQVEDDLERRRAEPTGERYSLMIVDLDDFKHVNDTMGHLVGDRMLVEAANRLRRVLGPTSVLARLGGDEFIVYRGVASDPDGLAEAKAVLEAFKAPFAIQREMIAVNISLGVAQSADGTEDFDGLMTMADLALYKAKANGKAQAQLFHEDMDTEYRYRQRLKTDLRDCVAKGDLTLAYQPLVDLKSRRVVACEALARWHHPDLGPIPPAVFIPLAEESGLISEITRLVLAAAALDCRSWPDDVSVSVNISAKDFRTGDVAEMVANALETSGLDPHRLELEITETALIEEREAATKILGALAAQGIGIALDDFGTGYSSLSYLQALPFTKLKIDRSFVMDIETSERALTLLTNVAQLGRDIDLTVTAEGVETEGQLALIREHTKVDQIQGYLFGVPLPRREVGELVARMAQGSTPEAKSRRLG